MILIVDYVHSATLKTIFDNFLFGTFGALWSLNVIFYGKVAVDTFVAHKK